MYGKGLLTGLGITFRHFFEKNITVQYPEQMPDLAERYRGCLNFEFEKCIACGICVSTCPNGVLHLETVKDENTNKKKLMSYSIDLQYCMFCNMCVENCPRECLFFDHNFELSQYNRENIKMVYNRPPHLDEVETARDKKENVKGEDGADDKQQKQLAAMKIALGKNPQKVLAKILDSEEDISIMSELLLKDEKIAGKIADLLVKDRDKAKKVAAAFVNKEKKVRAQTSENGEGGDL